MENLRTLNLSEKKDPIRDLWRNVLIVALEIVIVGTSTFRTLSSLSQLACDSATDLYLLMSVIIISFRKFIFYVLRQDFT